MSPNEAASHVLAGLAITREDIARAKNWIVGCKGGRTDELVDQWLNDQNLSVPREVHTEAPNAAEMLRNIGRAYSARLAFYQATWELLASGELIPAEGPTTWQASLAYRTSHGAGAIPLQQVSCSFPANIQRLPFASKFTADPDIFLQGINCKSLHSGILEAVDQALQCFKRGLYMPATAMLAAAAEATWSECGSAIAKKFSNAKLEATINDQYVGISKKVAEIRKALEQRDGKDLLKCCDQSMAKVIDAELWTTALRERRNALHWGKAKSFVADHSETGTLLMAAPLHLGTLETIRTGC